MAAGVTACTAVLQPRRHSPLVKLLQPAVSSAGLQNLSCLTFSSAAPLQVVLLGAANTAVTPWPWVGHQSPDPTRTVDWADILLRCSTSPARISMLVNTWCGRHSICSAVRVERGINPARPQPGSITE